MNNPLISKRPLTQHEKIRRLSLGAILIAISLTLGLTGWGFIYLPLPIVGATIFHIPVILAGILVGAEVGFLCGLIFGFFSILQFPAFPWFVLLPARPFIGVVSYYTFFGLKKLLFFFKVKYPETLVIPSLLAGIFGSLTNSSGTLGLGYYFKVFGKTLEVNRFAIKSSIPVVIIEAIVAGVIAQSLIIPLYHYLHPNENKS